MSGGFELHPSTRKRESELQMGWRKQYKKNDELLFHAVNLLWCLVTILPSSFTFCRKEGEEKVTHHHLNLSTEIETCCVRPR